MSQIDDVLKKGFNNFYDYMYEPNILKAAEEYSKKTVYKNTVAELKSLLLSEAVDIQQTGFFGHKIKSRAIPIEAIEKLFKDKA